MKKTALPPSALKVALVQNNAGGEVGLNLKRIEQLLGRGPPCDLIVLPEVFYIRGADQDLRASAQGLQDRVVQWLRNLARLRRAWLLAGSVIEKAGRKYFNTCLLLNRQGRIVAQYRKIHLFEAYLDDGRPVRERDVYEAGRRPVIAKIEGWVCGLSICYDLRFPELFRYYAEQGAHILCLPANFTQTTGKDHWEILLRARAIENQAFVVAPDQCGVNPGTGIASYGNSMAVGPWGEVLARAGRQDACVLNVTLRPESLRATRARIPVLRHRRLF